MASSSRWFDIPSDYSGPAGSPAPTNWWDGVNSALGKNSGLLLGLGSGLLSGNLAAIPQGVATGAASDRARNLQDTQMSRQAQQDSATAAFLAKQYPDLAAALSAGAPVSDVWSEAMQRMGPKAAKAPIKASQGDVFLDPDSMQPIASIPAAPDKPTSGIQEYEYAKKQGYMGTLEQFKTDMAKAGATNIDFNQNQGIAAGFADRTLAADQILSDPKLLAAMTDPTKGPISAIPGVGNYMVGPEFQMAQQAQRDFVNAVLRRESGAVISPSEFENAKQQYFPQPGDSPEVIAQKAANRKVVIQGLIRGAGENYQPPSLVPPGADAGGGGFKILGVSP